MVCGLLGGLSLMVLKSDFEGGILSPSSNEGIEVLYESSPGSLFFI